MVGGVWVGLFLGGGDICPPLRLLTVGQLAKSFTKEVQRSMLLAYVPVSSTSRVGANVLFPIPKLIIVCAIQFRRLGISVWLNSEGTVSGEVHHEGENEDPTVDAYTLFVALLRRLLTPYILPVLCIKGDFPFLVFPC
jgi:hypothetical protein